VRDTWDKQLNVGKLVCPAVIGIKLSNPRNA
jgi:hypothetical protein